MKALTERLSGKYDRDSIAVPAASIYRLPLIQQLGEPGSFVEHTVYTLTGDLTSNSRRILNVESKEPLLSDLVIQRCTAH